MAGFPGSKVAIIEVQVANQGCVIKGRPVRSCLAAAYQGREWFAPEVLKLGAEYSDGWTFKGSDGAAQGV